MQTFLGIFLTSLTQSTFLIRWHCVSGTVVSSTLGEFKQYSDTTSEHAEVMVFSCTTGVGIACTAVGIGLFAIVARVPYHASASRLPIACAGPMTPPTAPTEGAHSLLTISLHTLMYLTFH